MNVRVNEPEAGIASIPLQFGFLTSRYPLRLCAPTNLLIPKDCLKLIFIPLHRLTCPFFLTTHLLTYNYF
jgi:hypothetical protein